jgi:L-ascorbate metabolism protein UlaG (beta-lactamase superfamily)
MEITYFGHSCFMIRNGGASIIIDPFYDEKRFAPKPDFVVATHGHSDHLGHALELCVNGAKFIGIFELCNYLGSLGEIDAHPMNIGGFFDFGAFRLKLTEATHSSSADGIHEIGRATGVIVEIGGKTIYHAGDTGLFGDMELLGRRHKMDIAMLPIGGNYTMDIDDAVYAARLLKPKVAIPMHYGTFPVIQADPQEFAAKTPGGTVFSVGETREF